MIALAFFIIISIIISYIDVKKGLILDKIMFPSILLLILLKYVEGTLLSSDFIALGIILILFIVPIFFNMEFGGGDLRFGVFSALFLGLAPIGYFVMLSGIFHLILLGLLKKRSFPFAPAMSLGALGAYIIGSL